MTKTNHFVFIVLLILAWLIFVGLSIDAGGIVVNFIFSIYKPEIVKNLYQKLDLSAVYEGSQAAFYLLYGFLMVISVLKAFLFYTLVMLMHKIDMTKPFNSFVSRQITKMASCTFFIGILGILGLQSVTYLDKTGYAVENLKSFWTDSQAFILMAAVIYIIAVIFKKGVDIQNENDLTV